MVSHRSIRGPASLVALARTSGVLQAVEQCHLIGEPVVQLGGGGRIWHSREPERSFELRRRFAV
jgi:hypothetical protein